MQYYVYVHKRLSDGSIFYVGKGKNERLYENQGRNDYWKRIVEKDGGYTAEKIYDDLTHHEAMLQEIELISEIGLDKLSNMTNGGEGGDTRVGFTQQEYEQWIENKRKAQTGNTSYWKGKDRPNHSINMKRAHERGAYTYEWLKGPLSKEHRENISKSLTGRKIEKVECKFCGRMLPKTHLAVHQRGSKCK